jgi:small subunit ribosomal protein S1
MRLELRVVEVDPIHRRIVLTVVNIPEEQPPRPETPPTIHSDDEPPIPIMDADVM